MINGAITEYVKIGSVPKVGTVNTTPLTGNGVDMSLFHRVDFIVATGTINSTETVDALVEADSAVAFDSGNKATITGASSTAEVLSDDNVLIISVSAESVQAQGTGFRYARCVATGSGATGGPACIMAIGYPRYSRGAADSSPTVTGEIDAVKERKIV